MDQIIYDSGVEHVLEDDMFQCVPQGDAIFMKVYLLCYHFFRLLDWLMIVSEIYL
jgi:hypothetical protein